MEGGESLRTRVDWSSSSRNNYNDFCKKHPSVKILYEEWKKIIYLFNEDFKEYILQSGEKAKLPQGFGEWSINKKTRKKTKIDKETGIERINLPIDWKKTKEKGKRIYNFNYHTEGYSFRWKWFKDTARFKHLQLWWWKPSRTTSRLLAHYLKVDEKYQHLYQQWTNT